MASGATMKNSMVIYIGIIVVVIALVAILVLSGRPSGPGATTTAGNLTTVTVVPLTTTIVKNITMATGPNLASCNGYNVSISQASYEVVGSCNWRGGLMNVSTYGGSFQSATLQLVQQNVTLAPYNVSTTTGSCTPRAGVVYVPVGNYKVAFSTSALPQGSCGSATVRLSIG